MKLQRLNLFALMFIAFLSFPVFTLAQDSLVVSETGEVGIGTDSPDFDLEVVGELGISFSGNSSTYDSIKLFGTGYNSGNPYLYIMPTTAPGSGDLTTYLHLRSLTAGGTNKMSLLVDGNVGIGTTNPEHLLEVRGTGDSLSVGDDTNTQTYARFAHHRTMIGYSGSHALFQSGLGKEMRFNVNSNTYNNDTVAMVIDTDGNVAIGTPNPQGYKLYVNGTAFCNSGTWSGSDARWKKNIKPIEGALSKIDKLQGVTYEWDKEQFSDQEFEEGTQIGLVAQEVENVFPQLVRTDDKGYKAVSYEKMTAVLLEVVKTLKAENQELKQRLNTLEKSVAAQFDDTGYKQLSYLIKN